MSDRVNALAAIWSITPRFLSRFPCVKVEDYSPWSCSCVKQHRYWVSMSSFLPGTIGWTCGSASRSTFTCDERGGFAGYYLEVDKRRLVLRRCQTFQVWVVCLPLHCILRTWDMLPSVYSSLVLRNTHEVLIKTSHKKSSEWLELVV